MRLTPTPPSWGSTPPWGSPENGCPRRQTSAPRWRSTSPWALSGDPWRQASASRRSGAWATSCGHQHRGGDPHHHAAAERRGPRAADIGIVVVSYIVRGRSGAWAPGIEMAIYISMGPLRDACPGRQSSVSRWRSSSPWGRSGARAPGGRHQRRDGDPHRPRVAHGGVCLPGGRYRDRRDGLHHRRAIHGGGCPPMRPVS